MFNACQSVAHTLRVGNFKNLWYRYCGINVSCFKPLLCLHILSLLSFFNSHRSGLTGFKVQPWESWMVSDSCKLDRLTVFCYRYKQGFLCNGACSILIFVILLTLELVCRLQDQFQGSTLPTLPIQGFKLEKYLCLEHVRTAVFCQ